jgi:phage terminase large subunit-like protein
MKNATATKAWIRNASDRQAAANGCWFEPRAGAYAIWWIERYCPLYEGHQAGQPLILHGCHQCGTKQIPGEWFNSDGTENKQTIRKCLERATRFIACVRAGHATDWQYDYIMRLFGWQRYSDQHHGAIRRFRKTCLFVAKKNKKSPTLAALGLFLLCGDGEPGNHIYFVAKDGKQAKRIAGTHAIEMRNNSPELSAVCSVNKLEFQITHEPSRSTLVPLSSANVQTQESKEGLNGSSLVDEVHVVDREIIDRISRAGISRAEPLHAEVSTAGDDPMSYGKERFDHCLRVISGEALDPSLLAAVYAAPQDLTDAELDADPLKYGRLANPAMGHTIDPEEYLEDYRASRAGPLEGFAIFKMYRLNIWQRTGRPWIRESDWTACARQFTLESLAGQPCVAGIDLAKTRDQTSLQLIFLPTPARPEYLLWPFYWVPQVRVDDLRDKLPMLDWAARGLLEIVPGNWCSYEAIRAKLNWARKTFQLRQLAFDPKFADQVVQYLIEEDGWNAESEIFAFKQNDVMFTSPIDEFERLVLKQALHHPDHPVLNWQMGNALVIENPRTRLKHLGRKQRDHNTIDGVVAGVMGLAVAIQPAAADNYDDWYRPGSLTN